MRSAGIITCSLLLGILTAWPSVITAQPGPTIDGCPVFPADNIWNTRIDHLPVDPKSAAYINSIGADTGLHADFGAGKYQGAPIGIPFVAVTAAQPLVPIRFYSYPTESDPGPYPIPPSAPIEGGKFSTGDRHVLVIDTDNCVLYESYKCYTLNRGKSWLAGCGAVYDLTSNDLRPDGWTSADAAGLPLLAGLCRRNEVIAGEIRHALRFTVSQTRSDYVWPARHKASSDTNPNLPPMGQRFRLKSSFDVSPFPADVQVILVALKRYGMMLADNGSDWYISGVPDDGWNNDSLQTLGSVTGENFEAVDVSSLIIDPDSGQALQQN